jgi:hypothetical protein
VVSSYYCDGPYPTAGAEAPLTFDLTTGDPVDWKTIFKSGFLPPDDGEDSAHPSGLAKIYKARYRKKDTADDDCRGVIDDPSLSLSPILWLSAKAGLVDELDLSAADLAPYVKDATFLADVRTTVRSSAPVKAKASKAGAK